MTSLATLRLLNIAKKLHGNGTLRMYAPCCTSLMKHTVYSVQCMSQLSHTEQVAGNEQRIDDLNKFKSLVQRNAQITLSFFKRCESYLSKSDEVNMITLLSACTQLNVDSSQKVSYTRSYFSQSQFKNVTMYNILLNCYVENKKIVKSTEILKEMKELKIEPNAKTYAKLIALHCLNKDIVGAKQILEFLNSSDMKIPSEVYGYLSYGFCVSGEHEKGIKVMENLMQKRKSIPWETSSWLCRGLASIREIEHLNNVTSQLAEHTGIKMPVTQLINIYTELQKCGQENKILLLLKYANINEGSIKSASMILKTFAIMDAGFILENMYKNCNGSFNITNGKTRSMLINYLNKDANDFADFVQRLNKISIKFEDLALARDILKLLILEESPFVEPFVKKLVQDKNGIDIGQLLSSLSSNLDFKKEEISQMLKGENMDITLASGQTINHIPVAVKTVSDSTYLKLYNSCQKKSFDSLLKRLKAVKGHQLKSKLVANIILDAHYHMPAELFDTVLQTLEKYITNLSTETVNFIFCHYLEAGNAEKAKTFHEKFSAKMSFTMETIPPSVLTVADKEMRDFLFEYLEGEKGRDEAVWVTYTSLLKAGLTDKAWELIMSEKNFKPSVDKVEAFVCELAKHPQWSDMVLVLLKNLDSLSFINTSQLFAFSLEQLLQYKRKNEADNIVRSCAMMNNKQEMFHVFNSYKRYDYLPPVFVQSKHLKNMYYAANSGNNEMFLSALPSDSKFPFLFVAKLVQKLYLKLPVDEYDTFKTELNSKLPNFNPYYQSKIVFGKLKKLLDLRRFDEALDFSLTTFHSADDSNAHFWKEAVDVFGLAAMHHNRPDVLLKLRDSDLVRNTEKQQIEAYIQANQLLLGDSSFPDEETLEVITKLLLNANDVDLFKKVFEIICKNCLENSVVPHVPVAIALSGGEKSQMFQYFCDTFKPESATVEKIARLAYGMVKDFEGLLHVDSCIRKQVSGNAQMIALLNALLFDKSKSLVGDLHLSENTFKYITESYYQLPSFVNTDAARDTYQLHYTNSRYSNINVPASNSLRQVGRWFPFQ